MCVCDRGRTYLRRSTSVPSELYPTAKQLLVLMHDTPSNSMPVELALRTIAQLVPSQRSTSVRLPSSKDEPTAKQLLVLLHDTSNNTPREVALRTIAQLVPSQRSTSVPLRKYPTAKQLVVLVHDTPYRGLLSPVALALGLGTIAPLVPSLRLTQGS